MRNRLPAIASLFFLGHFTVLAQSAVPVWENLYRPAPPPPVNAPAIASRQLADGTILVVTDRFLCQRFDKDGNPVSVTQLAVSGRLDGSRKRPPIGSGFAEGADTTSPLDPGAAYAAIDGSGRVVVAFVADPGPFFPFLTGNIETNKFDGLTGEPLWPQPQVYDTPGGQYPTGVFLDPAGNVMTTGMSFGGGHNHVTIKYDGQSGAVIWGPLLISGESGVASLNFFGDVLVSVSRYSSGSLAIASLRYSGVDGSIIWGPVELSVPEGAAPTVNLATPGFLVVAGYTGYPYRWVVAQYHQDSGTLAWGPVFFDAPGGTNSWRPTSLASDALGHVVISGVSESGAISYVTMKLDGTSGAVLWGPITTPDGSASAAPEATIFGNGDLLLRAMTDGRLRFWRYRGSDGVSLWGPTDFGISPSGYPVTYFTSQILSDGNVFGSAQIEPVGASAFALNGATGSALWGPISFSVPERGFVYFEDMSTGPDGNLVAVGDAFAVLHTIKYDRSTGNVLWGPVLFDPGDVTRGWQVLIDAGGDAIVMGQTSALPGGVFLIKYAGATGATIWGPTYFPTMSPVRLALDSNGNAFVLGNSGTMDTNYDSALAKVSGMLGSVTWGPMTYDSGGQRADFPRALAVDAAGDAYVVGDSEPTNPGSSWFVLKYSGVDGSLLWGPTDGGLAGQPAAVVAGSGRVAVTGGGAVGNTGGMATIAFDASTGAVLWGPKFLAGTQPYADSGQALVVNGSGDFVAAGNLYNLGTGSDFATIKYHGSDGAVLWGPSLFDGSGFGDYVYTLGLGLDGSDNVVVGGTSYRSAHNSDIAVLKYAGATGATLWGPAYEGGSEDESLYGFGVNGSFVAVGSNSEGGMLTAVFGESFGIATPASALPAAFCASPYAFTLEARNGVTPYAWAVVSGSLPPGLSLSTTGILSGTPTAQGVYVFRVQAQDSASGSVQRDLTLSVLEGPSPFFLNTAFDGACKYTLSVTGPWSDILWLPGGETTPTLSVSPVETTTYGAVVDAGGGCPYHLSVTISGTKLQDVTCLAPALSSIVPPSGPASGTAVTIAGVNFQPGATVTIGALAATDVVVGDTTQITATTPVLAPGTVNDVTIVNPDSGNAALLRSFFADFLDVPGSDPFHDFIAALVKNGITAGCGGGNYCPSNPVTRAQMAVFLLKSRYGASHVPPPPLGLFNDVPVDNPFAPWIEELANLGITAGCGGGNYCPGNAVTRAQMAALLLRTRNGSGYAPPPATGIFGDVPASDPFAPSIEQIYAEGITGGCSPAPLLYCPASSATRGQMAVFLVKTFDLQ